jgi:hypothetical protein
MSVPLDVITRRKLILVRQIYQRAMVQSENLHSDFDRIMSLIAFDLASETVLKAVVGALEPSKTADKDFQAIIQQADALLLKNGLPDVPDKAKIQHVHGLRNDAQHKAKYPNNSDVSDARTYTRDFLQQLVLNVWDKDFSSLSLVELIRNPDAKTFLTEAEVKLQEGKPTQASLQAIAGFEPALNKAIAALVGLTPFFSGATERSDRVDLSGVYQEFESIRKTIAMPIIGLDIPTYLKYKSLTSYMGVAHFGGGLIDTFISGPEPSAEDAEFIVGYAVNSVIQIESLVGDVEKPFGGTHWQGFR